MIANLLRRLIEALLALFGRSTVIPPKPEPPKPTPPGPTGPSGATGPTGATGPATVGERERFVAFWAAGEWP